MVLSFVVLPIAGLLYAIYRFLITPAFLSPLAKIPNAHFTSSFIPTWIWWKRATGFETRSIVAAHEENGTIVRLAPNELSVASLDGLRQIYLGGFARDPYYYKFMNYKTPSLLTLLSYEQHSARKRMLSHVFSKSYLQNSADLQNMSRAIVFDRLLPRLHSAAAAGDHVDVFEMLQAAGMDFMSAYLFGLAASTDFIRDSADCKRYICLSRAKIRGYSNKAQAAKEIEHHCLSLCRAMEDIAPSDAIVYSRLKSGLSGSNLSPEEELLAIAAEMLDSMDASREGSGIAMTYLFYELSRRPDLQDMLRKELLTLSPSIESPTARKEGESLLALPQPRAIDSLPLLDAIVQETLRLHASAPGPQVRVVPASGTVIDGHAIPGGVRISTSARCLHFNDQVFQSPSAFIPERWLPRDQTTAKHEYSEIGEMRRWFWAFGSGGKMCIGNHFSLQVIKLVTAAVYTNFATAIIEDDGMEPRDDVVAGPVSDKLILQFRIAG